MNYLGYQLYEISCLSVCLSLSISLYLKCFGPFMDMLGYFSFTISNFLYIDLFPWFLIMLRKREPTVYNRKNVVQLLTIDLNLNAKFTPFCSKFILHSKKLKPSFIDFCLWKALKHVQAGPILVTAS